jgi:hypothetical protein
MRFLVDAQLPPGWLSAATPPSTSLMRTWRRRPTRFLRRRMSDRRAVALRTTDMVIDLDRQE